MISIHAPLRGRRRTGTTWSQRTAFQSTPPCGGDGHLFISATHHDDFNPRPLAGATLCGHHDGRASKISIHAPLRGRRMDHPGFIEPRGFQSTPPCGGDILTLSHFGIVQFQSTPPCGGDLCDAILDRTTDISIHAPLRGRQVIMLKRYNNDNFNPRPLAGATALDVSPAEIIEFQSTPPCGGDGHQDGQQPPAYDFNPRPLAGATLNPAQISTEGKNFNPRPLAGATTSENTFKFSSSISIHAPLRGRLNQLVRLILDKNFNPRPLAGATTGVTGVYRYTLISIHAPLRGRLPSKAAW